MPSFRSTSLTSEGGIHTVRILDKTDLLRDLKQCTQPRKDDHVTLVNTRGVRAKLKGLVHVMDDHQVSMDMWNYHVCVVNASCLGC